MNTATVLRRIVLQRHPGATCYREGNLYVVRSGEGRVLAARFTSGGAWAAAARSKQAVADKENAK